jgi:hypothetical protein
VWRNQSPHGLSRACPLEQAEAIIPPPAATERFAKSSRAAFVRGRAWAVVCSSNAISDLDRDFYWLYDRWFCSLIWGDDMLSYSGVLFSGIGAFVGLWFGSRAA